MLTQHIPVPVKSLTQLNPKGQLGCPFTLPLNRSCAACSPLLRTSVMAEKCSTKSGGLVSR